MKKILLLDPLGYFKMSTRHFHPVRDWTSSYIVGDLPTPPMDLMYAASYLRREGHAVKIIEGNIHHVPFSAMIRVVKSESPDFVLIPTTYFSIGSDKRLAGLIRDAVPAVKIIFSGAPVTYDPSLVLNDGSADFVALGELELSLHGILEDRFDGNIAYRKNVNILIAPRTLLDLAALPAAARDIVNNDSYRYAFFNKQNPVTVMVMSRGCAHSRCGFCPSGLSSLGQIRFRPFEAVTGEIEEIVHKYHIREIFFKDQTFAANRELVWRVCEHLISRDLRIFWRATTRVDLVDRELLGLMRRAGCYQISFGFESCSQHSLDRENKGITIEQSRKAARWAKDADLEVLGFFMLGLLGDTEESMSRLYGFARELEVDYAIFGMAYMLPGTPDYEQLKEKRDAFLTPEVVSRYATSAFLRFNLRPEFMWKQVRRIRSFRDFSFLAGVGLDSLKAYLFFK